MKQRLNTLDSVLKQSLARTHRAAVALFHLCALFVCYQCKTTI